MMDCYCRACLSKFNEPTNLLQYTEERRRLFVYSTGLQVKRNDAFTFQLCKACYDTMKAMCKFKKNCRASDKKIKSYMAIKDIEAEEELDFGTFLNKYHDPIMLKLPSLGGSTPVDHKSSDEDNESTSTSIQNFMINMIRADEIPDSEARIIREVIEEEADVLEDSLDSHWLEDAISVHSDFPLDESFNQFRTPQPHNDDPEYFSKRDTDETSPEKQYAPIVIDNNIKEPDKEDDSIFATPNVISIKTPVNINNDTCFIDKKLEDALKDENNQEFSLDDLLGSQAFPNASRVSTPTIRHILFGDKINEEKFSNKLTLESKTLEKCDVKFENGNVCHGVGLDETLEEKAMSFEGIFNEKVQKGSLDESEENTIDAFLNEQTFSVDPKPKSKIQINDLELTELLQEAYDQDIELNKYKKQHDITKEQNKSNEVNIISDIVINPEKKLLSPIENKYCITNFYCKMCQRKFTGLTALKLHFMKYHKLKINNNTPAKNRQWKLNICDYCGKTFRSIASLKSHIEMHMKPDKKYSCEICTLTFSSEKGLKQHKSTHLGSLAEKKKADMSADSKFICNLCGAFSTTSSNFSLHMKRHTKAYAAHCEVCGKGFYRLSELTAHIRSHTGERPYKCLHCERSFTRRDILNRHMKKHTNEKPFECNNCRLKFVRRYDLTRHHSKSKSCIS